MNRPTTNGFACSSAIYSTFWINLFGFGAVRNADRIWASTPQNRTYLDF